MLRHLTLLILFAMVAEPAFAQSDDAVVVVLFGGVQELPVRDLNVDSESISLGVRRVVPAGEDVRVADLKILPDGSHLLADVNGRGVALTPPDGSSYQYVLDDLLRMTSVRAATVGTFFAPGQPSVVGLTDSASGFASLREVSSNSAVWFERLAVAGSATDVVQLVIMPNNEAAVAFNWTSLGVSGIDFYDITGVGSTARIANIAHPDHPQNTVLVPGLESIRELMRLPDGTLLVTSRFSVFAMRRNGEIVWSLEIGDDPNLGGEFAAARLLPSGKIAITTFQPGEWSRPNANHRVHWFDPDTAAVVESSDVFLRAPIRVEPLAGHGGTGSFGFTAGLGEIGMGNVEEVSLERLAFSDPETVVGDRLSFSATLANNGSFSVAINSVIIEAFRGECAGRDGTASEIGRASTVAIAPGANFILNGDFLVTSTFGTGDWCAYVRLQDVRGNWFERGDGVPFSIVETPSQSESVTESTPLPFNEFQADAGMDGGADMGGPTAESGGGCCATQRPPKSALPLMLLLIAAILVIRPRSRAFGKS